MHDRRSFLGSAGGLAAAFAAGPHLLGAEEAPAPRDATIPDTLFLSWQRDPTTTMTVQWVGPRHVDPVVQHAPAPTVPGIFNKLFAPPPVWTATKTTAKPFPLTDLTVYRAELTGLTPGAEYRLRVGTEGGERRFRTMPAKATDEITFVSGGDCGANPHVIANNILAARQDPRFAVIGGDLAYDNGKTPKATLEFLRQYSQYMVDTGGRLIPMVPCIGNHEVVGGYGKTLKEAPLYHALFDGLFRDASYTALDFGDYLSLVLLDTGHAAKIGGEQTAWLGRALADRAGVPNLIVVNHVPAYPSFRPSEAAATSKTAGTGEENRKFWVPLFEKYQVDAVLEHHDHTFKRTHPLKGGVVDKNGVVYLGDGSWGKIRAPKAPEARPYLASVHQAYHMTVHRLEGEQRFHMAIAESGRIVDVCTTPKKPRHKVVSG